jgi:hypothetical protein
MWFGRGKVSGEEDVNLSSEKNAPSAGTFEKSYRCEYSGSHPYLFHQNTFIRMKNLLKKLAAPAAVLALTPAVLFFLMRDPQPDFRQASPQFHQFTALNEVPSDHDRAGTWKSVATFRTLSPASEHSFFGQEISVQGNEQLDRIRIGITGNLISRIEIWKQDQLVETKELGFVGKMTWGKTHRMSVDFRDATNARYAGKSNIHMRCYSGSGFLGDVATISMDLSDYGDLSGAKSIGMFSEGPQQAADVADLSIWKNYQSFD